uniref:SFRICE_025783 n=1 Tax=Spodoptera frugiperda TaxID=7108 RepID=A0A2H1WQ89_SPOFR
MIQIVPEHFDKKAEDKVLTQLSPMTLKIKLEETLRSAKVLAETLNTQIVDLMKRENLLKNAITNGR